MQPPLNGHLLNGHPYKATSILSPDDGFPIVLTSIKRPLSVHFPEGDRLIGVELQLKQNFFPSFKGLAIQVKRAIAEFLVKPLLDEVLPILI